MSQRNVLHAGGVQVIKPSSPPGKQSPNVPERQISDGDLSEFTYAPPLDLPNCTDPFKIAVFLGVYLAIMVLLSVFLGGVRLSVAIVFLVVEIIPIWASWHLPSSRRWREYHEEEGYRRRVNHRMLERLEQTHFQVGGIEPASPQLAMVNYQLTVEESSGIRFSVYLNKQWIWTEKPWNQCHWNKQEGPLSVRFDRVSLNHLYEDCANVSLGQAHFYGPMPEWLE